MSLAPETLLEAGQAVLAAGAPEAKVAAAQAAMELIKMGAPLGDIAGASAPSGPARPVRPPLVPPAGVPRRRLSSPAGRAALLHAIAHIEFNAIDLAFDMAIRFCSETDLLGMDTEAFVKDWISVGGDEARHFGLISERLADLDCAYGDLPAHNGLWEAADATAGNLLARLVVAPLILEARGLDVTPDMIERLRVQGDEASVSVLEVIYRDEIGHVACGKRWFSTVCARLELEPVETFRNLQEKYFSGRLKPPFNHSARDAAGLDRAFYERRTNQSDVKVDG